MEIKNALLGSGIVNIVSTLDDYAKVLKELYAQVYNKPFETGTECLTNLEGAMELVGECESGQIPFDFHSEETLKACIFSVKDWLAAKSKTKFDVFKTLYHWKLEKFKHRAWDLSMVADNCEGILFRLMERVSGDSQNIAVVQVFLSISELESADNPQVRIETRLKDGLEKLKNMVEENVPLVGVTKN